MIFTYTNCQNLCLKFSKHIPYALDIEFVKTAQIHEHQTRLNYSGNYYLPRATTKYGQKTLRFRGTELWTDLDMSIKQLGWLSFKKATKQSLIESYRVET